MSSKTCVSTLFSCCCRVKKYERGRDNEADMFSSDQTDSLLRWDTRVKNFPFAIFFSVMCFDNLI